MGGVIRKLKNRFRSNEWPRVLILGLDGAGKTAILYRLKHNEPVSTRPTIGFNLEEITYKKMHFFMWDVGGQTQVRSLWRHYCTNTWVLIFVVDSSDAERMDESREELWKLLAKPELKDSLLLVMVNKQDLPATLSVTEVTERLELNSLKDRTWSAIGTSAETGEGLKPSLKWMTSEINHRYSKKKSKQLSKCN